MEAAYTDELSNRIDEINNLSDEVVALKSTIDELLINSNKPKLGRQDSSLEFEFSDPTTGFFVTCEGPDRFILSIKTRLK